ncbi:MAG TPA: MerR family DNA-binding transcriptional regulator [Micromonosporaceae bacterium]
MHSIGEMARATGLTVSALRFYDSAGVLVPAKVDPASGYRRYAEHQIRLGRLLASLRRVGMPLVEINRVLERLDDPSEVHDLLDAHLRHLERGLADARRELSRARSLIEIPESPMTTRLTLRAAALAGALDAVRFAVGNDPDLPALGGILIDVEHHTLRLVATDRCRLAVAETAIVAVDGADLAVIAPVALADRMRPLLARVDSVTLRVDADSIAADIGGERVVGEPLQYDFPDYRRLLGEKVGGTRRRVRVDVAALRRALAAPTAAHGHADLGSEVAVLAVDSDDALVVADSAASDDLRIAVNREFLLEALDAPGIGQLVLDLDGPIKPLVIRVPDSTRTYSVLMPIRL